MLANFFNIYTGLKTVALVRKEDAVENMRKLGATKVIVTKDLKTSDEYA